MSSETAPAVPGRKRARRKRAGRTELVAVRLAQVVWEWADDCAERAGWALGAWVVLLAEDVIAGVPAVSEEQLSALRGSRVGVVRIGSAVNSMAATEHLGTAVDEAQLEAVLGRLQVRVAEAMAEVAGVVVAMAQDAGGGQQGGPGALGRARRMPEGIARDRLILLRVSPAERARLAGAAAAEGVAVGAWLGLLLEDPDMVRPLRGEVWAAVSAMRKALRAVATNLVQIEAVQGRRGASGVGAVVAARGQVEDAIRACLDAQAVIGAAGQAVAA